MNKKTVYIELPCELVDRIDNINDIGDRSKFIGDILRKQVDTIYTTKMKKEILE